MFYTIYKVTNTVNGKYYIGKHQTKDLQDGYMGSGKLLKKAIQKYGISNFHKEILYVFNNEKEMDFAEKILVVPDLETNYNLCPGGHGGWGYLNNGSFKHIERTKKGYKKANLQNYNYTRKFSIETKRKISLANKRNKNFLGKKHSEETKRKISLSHKNKHNGNKNHQYGTHWHWITNGIENKKIKKEQLDLWLEKGYNVGRIK